MYSQNLSELAEAISKFADPGDVHSLIDRGMRCYLSSIAEQLNGTVNPLVNISDTLIQASLLSSIVSNNSDLPEIEKLHYLVAMILEQQGGLIARKNIALQMNKLPQENDYWYLLTLAFLHYLAGGFRVQAKTIVINLQRALTDFGLSEEYFKSSRDIWRIFTDRFDFEKDTFFINSQKFENLLVQIRKKRVTNLNDLGLNDVREWLSRRNIKNDGAISFWERYLQRLSQRGITTFTKEQIDNDFDNWLKIDNDLLVILPTGSGKTIIGELKTALTLSIGKQVVWLLPIRSLVRQTQIEMEEAFTQLGISVQELPTTDDLIPLFSNINFSGPMVAITTPEKFLALIRANDNVLQNIGLIVIDEAQNLFEDRGFAIESVLFQLSKSNPTCKFVFLSAMPDKEEKLAAFYNRLKPSSDLSKIISTNRPTRCSYGIFTSIRNNSGFQVPVSMCYPAFGPDKTNFPPNIIQFPETKAKKWLDNPSLIKNFIKNSQSTNLRSVIFVGMRASTETRAREFVSNLQEKELSEEAYFDLSRIKIERGEYSPFINCYKREIAPHHGSLPHVEQIIIEKWIRKGFIKNVIATPTLAQGVNLPFDISIISFLSRYDTKKSKYIDLSEAEVLNMLGRAGRAGMVSDGLSLISRENSFKSNDPKKILKYYQHWFFQNKDSTNKLIGLSRILINLIHEDFDSNNWLKELSGFEFNDAMSLNIILAKTCLDNPIESLEEILRQEIGKYPSINDLQDQLEKNQDVAAFFAKKLMPIAEELSTFPSEVLLLMAKTGLPLDFCIELLIKLKSTNIDEIETPLSFATNFLTEFFTKNRQYLWIKQLQKISVTKSFEITNGFNAIEQWYTGKPWVMINSVFSKDSERNNINLGSFLNYKIPQLAQFWGAFAICEKVLFGPESHYFDFVQPMVRYGIDSKQKLIVLKEIGYFDRVLAHKLTPYFEIENVENIPEIEEIVLQKISRWRTSSGIFPLELNNDEIMALKSILHK